MLNGRLRRVGGIVEAGQVHFPQAQAVAVEVDYINTAVVLADAEEVFQRHTEDMANYDHINT